MWGVCTYTSHAVAIVLGFPVTESFSYELGELHCLGKGISFYLVVSSLSVWSLMCVSRALLSVTYVWWCLQPLDHHCSEIELSLISWVKSISSAYIVYPEMVLYIHSESHVVVLWCEWCSDCALSLGSSLYLIAELVFSIRPHHQIVRGYIVGPYLLLKLRCSDFVVLSYLAWLFPLTFRHK